MVVGPTRRAGRVLGEQEAVALLDSRAGYLDRDEAMRLGQVFNTQEMAGRVRQDRFSPAFAGATMHKVTEDLDRFNDVVAELWTADIDTALDTLGGILGDRSLLPGAGSSLPSMLLYLRDPDRFGVCINATTRGLAAATRRSPFHADGRGEYERFCQSLAEWRTRYGVAPQEADAVLTALWRDARGERTKSRTITPLGQAPLRFLADLNNGTWMQANQDRYCTELRQPFVNLLEQIAERHLRELDPQLDTAVKTNRVLPPSGNGSPTSTASTTRTCGGRSAEAASRKTSNSPCSFSRTRWRRRCSSDRPPTSRVTSWRPRWPREPTSCSAQ